MQIEDRGVIYDATRRPESERVASFTSLCQTSSGTILSAFQIGSGKHALDSTIRLCRSRDRGRSWEELSVRFERNIGGVPGSLGTGEIVEVAAGRLLLICTWLNRSDPERPFFDPVTQGILPCKQLAAFSSDEGASWSPWRELNVAGLKGCAGTGPILRWPNGIVAYPFESYKEFDDPDPGVHAAWFMVSRDDGLAFGNPLLVAQDPEHKIYYWDQRLCLGNLPGEFVGLFWTHDLENKKDLNVHIGRGRLNGGALRNGPISDTGIPGQIGAPLQLADGRLVAFVVNRGQPGTMTLWLSPDNGGGWPERVVVYIHDKQAPLGQGPANINFEQYWADMIKWSFGHPAIRYLGQDKVLLAYYAGPPNCLSVHWARVNLKK